jgi:DNA-binding MarR family transcriptional regulator
MPSERLEKLANELFAMAEEMRRERYDATTDVVHIEAPLDAALSLDERSDLLGRWSDLAGQLYRFRRQRDRMFGTIFGEPAWDILLDLFVMEARGKRVPVSSACIASGASHSTALRQIDELVRHRLVSRERDANDKRRTYVMLSEMGLRKLVMALEQLGARPEWGIPG